MWTESLTTQSQTVARWLVSFRYFKVVGIPHGRDQSLLHWIPTTLVIPPRGVGGGGRSPTTLQIPGQGILRWFSPFLSPLNSKEV